MVTLLVCLILFSVSTNQHQGSHLSEQVDFSAEESGVQRPIPIPEGVLAILRNQEMVRYRLEYANIPAEKMPRSWFSASAIHLSSSKRTDFIVMAVGPLGGVDGTTFWIFQATGSGYELVLDSLVHNLHVKNTRWNGLRDIELVSLTAVQISTTICRFDGRQYTACNTKSEPIR